MAYYNAIAIRPGGTRKSIINKSEDTILTQYVIPFVTSGAIRTKWGSKTTTQQVVELRIYKSDLKWARKSGITIEAFLKGKRNLFNSFENRAKAATGVGTYRVFVVMPIQGEKYGTQNQQRIQREFDMRFESIEAALSDYNCVAIRIDKEHPLDQLVTTIKKEIRRAAFIIADLTDERPFCYFEAGYAEACGCSIIYVASKESVISPGQKTNIHFDVHMNVNFFSNNKELAEKLSSAITKNKALLFNAGES